VKRTALISFLLAVASLAWMAPQLFQPAIGQAASVEAPHIGEGGLPQFQVDPTFPKVPAKWRMGFGVNVAVDADDHIWILSRPGSLARPTDSRRSPADPPPDLTSTAAAPVTEFDKNGNFIRGWGGESGPGYQWPSLEHGIAIDPQGFVWIVGNADGRINNPAGLPADNQILKFTKDGKFVMAIGKSGQTGSNATEVLSGADDMAFHARTHELFVADGDGNSRIMVYDSDTGKFKRMWGAYGNKPLDVDARPVNPEAKALCPTCPLIGGAGFPVLQQYSVVHDVAVSSDGLVYVAERGNKRVQVFTTDGKFIAEQFIGLDVPGEQGTSVAFSPDERFLYVAGSPITYILNRKTLEILGTFPNPNRTHTNHGLAVDHEGNLYTANFQTEPVGKVGGAGAYRLAFKGYSPKTPCPPCESTKSAVEQR